MRGCAPAAALSARCGHRVHAAMCSARHAGCVQSRRAATCAVRRYQACPTRFDATGCFPVKWPSSALTPTRLYSTWEPSQGAPYHYTLLTCVKAVVRTTALLTRPHTHPLNITLQERPRTNRHTNYHKHSTQQSIFLSLCCKRLQKLRVVKDEVVERSSLRCIHRTRSERAA